MELYVKKELYDDMYDQFNAAMKELDGAKAAEGMALAAYNRIYAENANTQRAYKDMANINERQKKEIERLLSNWKTEETRSRKCEARLQIEKDRNLVVPYPNTPFVRVTASNPVDDQKIMELSGRLRAICAVIQKRYKTVYDRSVELQSTRDALLSEIARAGKIKIKVPETPPVEVTMEDL